MSEKTTSLRGLADLLGVSDTAVRKALKAGVFSDGSIHRDATGNPSVVNVTLAVTEWKRSGRQVRTDDPAPASARVVDAAPPLPADDPQAELAALLARVRTLRQSGAAASPGPGDDAGDGESGVEGARDAAEGSVTLVEAQKETHIQRARMLRMENDLREGTLVEADQAARQAFEFSRTVRENVLNVPARIAAELAAESDASRVHVRLEAALREALSQVAAILDASAAPPPTPLEG